MKKLLVFLSIFLLVLGVAACSKVGGTAGDNNNLIEPGDKLGDFVVTKGIEGKFTYGFSIDCSEPGTGNTYTCNVQVGQSINVSTGLTDTSGTGKLDEVWSHSNYQIFINDRQVDLPAFGTIDYVHTQVGTIRFANVVITASKPGQITVRDSGVYDNGDQFSSTSTYNFSAP